MSKQVYGLNPQTVERWKRGFQKKKNDILLNPFAPVTINPAPVQPSPVQSPQPKVQSSSDSANAFESLFSDPDPNRMIKYDKDIWKVNFPKVAEDLIDPAVFKENVVNAVLNFIRVHFPLDVEVADKIQMRVERVEVSDAEYDHYPTIQFRPIFEGPENSVDEFLKPFHQWSGHELYWKGSFLKNKTTNKITGMRLTGLAYSVPDQFVMGQPIAYIEKSIV